MEDRSTHVYRILEGHQGYPEGSYLIVSTEGGRASVTLLTLLPATHALADLAANRHLYRAVGAGQARPVSAFRPETDSGLQSA